MTVAISTRLGTILVFAGALLLFGPTAVNAVIRVTDLSALRVLDGDVPYRDFWTMYAPGSFVTLALVFKLFGRQLIISNAIGILLSATAVAVYFRLVYRVAGGVPALIVSGIVIVAFYGSGYHNGFASYPPAILLILSGVLLASARCTAPGAAWATAPGVLFGAAMLYKHDIAIYALIAASVALVVTRRRARLHPQWRPVLMLGAGAAIVVVPAIVTLIWLGAGPDTWEDLIRFPIVDFKHVRAEYFPLLPQMRATFVDTAQELVGWGVANLPTLALIAGAAALWRSRRTLPASSVFILTFAVLAFALHWNAAHVQMNTNAITLAAWGGLVGACGMATLPRPRAAWLVRSLTAVAVAGWASVYVAHRIHNSATRPAFVREALNLPGLAGLSGPPQAVKDTRDLAAAIAAAAEPGARLLFLCNRNDITMYAGSLPFWLTPRRPATRYHEMHPGVTDTEPRQLEMIRALATQPLPVVVREHRFSYEKLDGFKEAMLPHAPIGATLIDAWVAARYAPGPRFGQYEVMRPLGGAGVTR